MSEFRTINTLPGLGDVTFEQAYAGESPIVWDVSLPAHIDPERLQINMSRLNRLQRIGAICTTMLWNIKVM